MGKRSKSRDDGENPSQTNLERNTKRKGKKEVLTKECEKETPIVPTVSVAVAGSIIDNTQSFELATRLAGQIARAITIFRVDEVVVFDSNSSSAGKGGNPVGNCNDEDDNGSMFLIKILRYLETPQYLRKALFPMCSSLKHVGLLPPLDAPHHLRKHEWGPFREGVTLKGEVSGTQGTLVDVGLSKNVLVEETLDSGKRVTVAMGTNRNLDDERPRQIVPSSRPREETGSYWGYRVRYASNLSSAITHSPYKGGYDLLLGTSEHGEQTNSSTLSLPRFRHLLIAFGGLAGLEECIEEDDSLKGKKANDVFHAYINTCPGQGSRTIRTEEALFISLQYFQEPIGRALGRVFP